MGISLFFQVTSDKMQGNGLNLRKGKFRLDIRRISFTGRVLGHCIGLPRQVLEPLSQVFKKRLSAAPNAMT